MRLHDPWLLPLLVPLLLALPLLVRRERQRDGLRFPTLGLLANVPDTLRARAARWLPWLRYPALVLLLLALARPQSLLTSEPVRAEGIDIVLAVDVSTSMLAEDLVAGAPRQSRLAAAREVLREFVGRRGDDRLALVAFAARPYLVAPLTLDGDWLRSNLDRLESGLIEDGTALGDALLAALNRFPDKPKRERVVILLTDGRSNAGDVAPAVATEAARALGARVYTIGVGGTGEAFFPFADPLGGTSYRRVRADLDEATLTAIAQRTGGAFFRATDPAALAAVYRAIDRLERRPIEERVARSYAERFPPPLLAGLLLLALELLLAGTLLRRAP